MGSNAELVNLDSLIAPLPPSTGVNPFGIPIPVRSTPPTSRSTNPFESSKPPAPTLQQLQVGDGFGELKSLAHTHVGGSLYELAWLAQHKE